MNTSWHSYPKVWALGHSYLGELLLDPVVVEEKIDGSQFSFGVFSGELKVRSKGQQMNPDVPEKMFEPAVATVKSIQHLLKDGWTYRAEFLGRPKHNVLTYSRTPASYLIVFDISPAEEQYLPRQEKEAEALRLGLEVVPVMFEGRVESAEQVKHFLELESCLGGPKIEGIVLKNYRRFGVDKKALMGKYVSEAFKEVHKTEWSAMNPKAGDIIEGLKVALCTQARWHKAVQHLREQGKLEGSPRDIGHLIKEVRQDVSDECMAEVKQRLFNWAWPQIERSLSRGLPEWYKDQLLAKQFEESK
jgi:hypothetical protein